MILEAEHVTFYYRRKDIPVLKDISLSVSSGERVGLKAPSGRGKTTLCRLLAGYERPVKGQILLDGKLLKEYRGICPVQMVWQHPETVVDPLLRLRTTLEEAGHVEQRLLDHLHIEEEWLDRYPSERPEVKFLLCDEISAMLDLVTQAQIWNFLLEEARRRDLGMLIVSHDDALLRQVCTRVETLPFETGGDNL